MLKRLTPREGTVDPAPIDCQVIFGALAGAIAWNLITRYSIRYSGLPSRPSHPLIGGLVGRRTLQGRHLGADLAGPAQDCRKTVAFIVIWPLPGFVLGSLLMLAVSWIFFRVSPRRVDTVFRRLQLLSASLCSLGHGGDDAQKTAGIIWMLLIATTAANPGLLPHRMHAHADHLPGWIVAACYVTIGAGTMSGGWRIVWRIV